MRGSARLIDDHSRLALAWLAARGETSTAAITVLSRPWRATGCPKDC
ncbi:hypothetical protein ACSL103130_07345 [Actinomyces slackii]|uniref:Uncharacterized protein n=1 Tax=Actinomyces slackii TaxID=52774 RepID=A0A3S4WIV6_9ACTO|nr:Uncharacterised protein [Actinomyces slackii]VEG75969.1 Uncharacterised protein [Actinomyces slackii]